MTSFYDLIAASDGNAVFGFEPSPIRQDPDEQTSSVDSTVQSVFIDNEPSIQQSEENQFNYTTTPLRQSLIDDTEHTNASAEQNTDKEEIPESDFLSTSFSDDSDDEGPPELPTLSETYSHNSRQNGRLLHLESDESTDVDERLGLSSNQLSQQSTHRASSSIHSSPSFFTDNDDQDKGWVDTAQDLIELIPDAAVYTFMLIASTRTHRPPSIKPKSTSPSTRCNKTYGATQSREPKSSQRRDEVTKPSEPKKGNVTNHGANNGESSSSYPQGKKADIKSKTEKHDTGVERESHTTQSNKKDNFLSRLEKAIQEHVQEQENKILGKKKAGDKNNYQGFEARFVKVAVGQFLSSPDTAVKVFAAAMVRNPRFLNTLRKYGVPEHLTEEVSKLITVATIMTLWDTANYEGVTDPRQTKENLQTIWNKQLEEIAKKQLESKIDETTKENVQEFRNRTEKNIEQINEILKNPNTPQHLREALQKRLNERRELLLYINCGAHKDHFMISVNDEKKTTINKTISKVLSDNFIRNLAVDTVAKLFGAQTMLASMLVEGTATGVVESLTGNGGVSLSEIEEFLADKENDSQLANSNETELLYKVALDIAHTLTQKVPDKELSSELDKMLPHIDAASTIRNSPRMNKTIERLVENHEKEINESMQMWERGTQLLINEALIQLEKVEKREKQQDVESQAINVNNTTYVIEELYFRISASFF